MNELERKIGYEFKNKKLLKLAMTHCSAGVERNGENNQRLEFLGDSVLQLVVSRFLYDSAKNKDEGLLSKLRSIIVCADSLHYASQSIELNKYVILGKGEEKSGGRNKKNILADAMESLIAAIYLDGGYSKSQEFILNVLDDIIEQSIKGTLKKDYKTMLQEYVQATSSKSVIYRLVNITGPEHNQTFYSTVVIGEHEFGISSGKNKKESEQNAAAMALDKIKELQKE